VKILRTRQELQNWLTNHPNPAFIPTMGALHEGHLSLVFAASSPKLVSLFINPRQFSPEEDLEKYPRDLEGDCKKLEESDVDAIFLPTEEEIYGSSLNQGKIILPSVFQTLEGAERPTHFQGVAEVLFQFFSLISPSRVFFGQKDFQQTVLIRWLLKKYFPDISLHVCPIVREQSGLAMSSRNIYFSDQQQKKAAFLFETLEWAKDHFLEQTPRGLEKEIQERFQDMDCISQIDYICIANAETLQLIDSWKKGSPLVLLIAVQMGRVRLLDNILLR